MLNDDMQDNAVAELQQQEAITFWKHVETQWKKSKEFEAKIKDFCYRCCPAQIYMAPFLAVEFCGREEELDKRLSAMYNYSLLTDINVKEKEDTTKEKRDVHYHSAPMARAITLSSFFGLDSHFVLFLYKHVKKKCAQRRRSMGKSLSDDRHTNTQEEEEENYTHRVVLFEVLVTLFPDIFCSSLENNTQQTAFAIKRLTAFLSFHEPNNPVSIYFSGEDYKYVYNIFQSLFLKHYAPFLQYCEIPEKTSIKNINLENPTVSFMMTMESINNTSEDVSNQHRTVRKILQNLITEYSVCEYPTFLPFRSRGESSDVALDTFDLNVAEKIKFMHMRLNRNEIGTMTQPQLLTTYGTTNYLKPHRTYGTGLSLLGGVHDEAHITAMRLRREYLQNPRNDICSSVSNILTIDNCPKCVVLETHLTQMKESLRRANLRIITNEEKQYYEKAVCYARQEQILQSGSTSIVFPSISAMETSYDIFELPHMCLICKDLQRRIQQLEKKLQESYDCRRDLLFKRRSSSQLPSDLYTVVLKSTNRETTTRNVSTMTELTGQELDDLIGYIILDSL